MSQETKIVAGATRLFVESGALDTFVDAAAAWFQAYFERTMP